MDQGWSPGLIAQLLTADHRAAGGNRRDHTGRVSHETIYQALYVQTRGSLRADLHRQLSLKRSARKPQGSRDGRGRSLLYAEAFTISQRPAEVADRAVPGHWEGDLIVGPESSRRSGPWWNARPGSQILLHLPGRHDAHTVAEAMIAEMRKLPEGVRPKMLSPFVPRSS